MDNYNYPMGADTPDAPWNQSNPDPVDVNVCVSTSLSRSTTIQVDDYVAEAWEDWDVGDEGETIHNGGIDYNFSDSDLVGAYKEQEYTILELLDILKKYLQADIDGTPHSEKNAKNILKYCDGWTEDELEVVED